MYKELIHVYFMPGMAASPSIFEYIKLPKNQFKVHLLEWFIPTTNETIENYAKRMLTKVTHKNSVIVGVSFGGVLVQEMSRLSNFKKVIIISSVKTRFELPKRMKLSKKTKAYKLIPTHLMVNVEVLAKYVLGDSIKKRLALYEKYLSVRDKRYLDWAIEQIICWKNEKPLPNIIHIHGDNDAVFPIKNINNCITVLGGTHIMIINRFRWFNENLPKLILS